MARKYSTKKRTTKSRTRIQSSKSGGKGRTRSARPKAKPKKFTPRQIRAYVQAVENLRTGQEE